MEKREPSKNGRKSTELCCKSFIKSSLNYFIMEQYNHRDKSNAKLNLKISSAASIRGVIERIERTMVDRFEKNRSSLLWNYEFDVAQQRIVHSCMNNDFSILTPMDKAKFGDTQADRFNNLISTILLGF
jgi:hypothetical protein